jgi:uncharacterized protein (TIGR00299 family) protein
VIGWLDCASGASGDMLLGALVDAGVPLDVLATSDGTVAGDAVSLRAEPVTRGGSPHCAFTSTQRQIRRSAPWADVRRLLDAAPLAEPVRARASSTFGRLATAEAAAHGVPVEDVHFHEVGALDAIADIVGACAGLGHLELDALHCSPVAVGSGTAATAHGSVSVPPPPWSNCCAACRQYGGDAGVELCTPTGAALLTEWVSAWGSQPAMAVSASGSGAGARDLTGQPNVVRLLVGEPAPVEQPAAQRGGGSDTGFSQLTLATNVDDLDPRLWPGILGVLIAAGAADAWLTPIVMKKGPAGAHADRAGLGRARALVRRVIFAETSAIGLRETAVAKYALDRSEVSVDVFGQPVRVKLASVAGEVCNAQPEFDDVTAAAAATGRPAKLVLAEAIARARQLW